MLNSHNCFFWKHNLEMYLPEFLGFTNVISSISCRKSVGIFYILPEVAANFQSKWDKPVYFFRVTILIILEKQYFKKVSAESFTAGLHYLFAET